MFSPLSADVKQTGEVHHPVDRTSNIRYGNVKQRILIDGSCTMRMKRSMMILKVFCLAEPSAADNERISNVVVPMGAGVNKELTVKCSLVAGG